MGSGVGIMVEHAYASSLPLPSGSLVSPTVFLLRQRVDLDCRCCFDSKIPSVPSRDWGVKSADLQLWWTLNSMRRATESFLRTFEMRAWRDGNWQGGPEFGRKKLGQLSRPLGSADWD